MSIERTDEDHQRFRADMKRIASSQKAELSLPAIQRLEAWMKEITDCLCYQPEIPMTHKSCLVDAFVAFQNELTTLGVDTPRK